MPLSDISLASDLWTSTLFLSPDCRLLPNPWICLPVSAAPCLTPFLCLVYQFKPSPLILSPVTISLALILFLSHDHWIPLTYWVTLNQGVSFTVSQILCDVILLSPAYSPEELKISTLTLPDSKKLLSALWSDPNSERDTPTDKQHQIIECLSIPYRLLLSGHQPCFAF
ncbi:hypothetical protein XENOCAPTIV_020794 [Xenoophorus captivus]|uniref:Uncharacterized protein n=1 Tax=Xenoophorus captivus TaxID=1517983 RepID=A0ABV0RB46_9TELE